ncbi:DUF1800 domain-containing protein [Paenibacillus lutrae]|uniref:DUF1800 family protein n=1 Tax=Paenibacillus lutrae TaxID=2078573 RepID=A0A7X3FFY4_9BACL|nr:DUF1800 domain-containing protein [Paenibacillus lutrae]MVO99008.1 DUF1800 family protein [Paenibacillus lutrae]
MKDWSEKEVLHLLGRTSFSAVPSEVQECLKLGKEESVRRLTSGIPLIDGSQDVLPFGQVKADDKPLIEKGLGDQQTYWLYRMIASPTPLIEKMTLFWHSHFASSYYKVSDMMLMVRQNELLRKHALGSFRSLLDAIRQDPAMMLYLDVSTNRKGSPNENYAREMMELFTLGIGNYKEEDVKEAARALTGWSYDRKADKVQFVDKQHDEGGKVLLGESGRFNAEDTVIILMRQTALPKFIASKLLTYFGTENPPEAWIDKVARNIKKLNTIGDVLYELLISDEFYEPAYRMSLVKTPAEYVAGAMRSLDIPLTAAMRASMGLMGMDLYAPPDISGWKGGASWLSTSRLLARYQFADKVSKRVTDSQIQAMSPAESGAGGEAYVERWSRSVGIPSLGRNTAAVLSRYASETIVASKKPAGGKRSLLQLLLISPEAQMK